MSGGARPRLVFATRNRGKIIELRALLAGLQGDPAAAPAAIEVLSLDELDPSLPEVPEVIEDGETFAANATKKALAVSRATGLPALADDSGLEVDALGGVPGVMSARYAGPRATDEDNNRKLLVALQGVPAERRTARFRSVLALADTAGPLGDEVILAHGVCEGRILEQPRGTGGFGYDPLFHVPALGATFAELGVGTKNDLSHRARAMQAMQPHLEGYFRLAKPGHSG